jgi:hypothetical protein
MHLSYYSIFYVAEFSRTPCRLERLVRENIKNCYYILSIYKKGAPLEYHEAHLNGLVFYLIPSRQGNRERDLPIYSKKADCTPTQVSVNY